MSPTPPTPPPNWLQQLLHSRLLWVSIAFLIIWIAMPNFFDYIRDAFVVSPVPSPTITPAPLKILNLRVEEEESKEPIKDMKVVVESNEPISPELTDSNGFVQIQIPSKPNNTVKVILTKDGYKPYTENIYLGNNFGFEKTFSVSLPPEYLPSPAISPQSSDSMSNKEKTQPAPSSEPAQPLNQFRRVNYPKSRCGDPLPTSPSQYPVIMYPVFVDYSEQNLDVIKRQFCRDAFEKKREKVGITSIQVASFVARQRAEEFRDFIKSSVGSGEVGEPTTRDVPPTSQEPVTTTPESINQQSDRQRFRN